MASVAITVDGVLRKMVGGAPIPVGLELYHALATTFRVVLLSDYAYDDTAILQFLDANQCFEHVKIIGTESVILDILADAPRVQQVNRARALGQNVQLVVEPDPAMSSVLIEAGYNTLTFTPAEYTVPAWRPGYDGTARPWESLSKAVAEQARLKAEDARLKRLANSESQ